MARTIELIGAPFDLCGPQIGSRLGPIALRLGGLPAAFRELGYQVVDSGDAWELNDAAPAAAADRHAEALKAYRLLKQKVQAAVEAGNLPIVLGGDHSLAIGSISGALACHGASLAVLWVDAHLDLNTPATTPSENLHGMPLGALARLPLRSETQSWSPDLQAVWEGILGQIVPDPGLDPAKASWVGLRDIDQEEQENIPLMQGSLVTTMHDIDRWGIGAIADRLTAWMSASGAKQLWISFDVDCFDPVLAPGTGTAVRGGISYREGQLLAEILHQYLIQPDCPVRLAGMDLVEVNPMGDTDGETAAVAREWAASLLGKQIAGRSRIES